MARPDSLTAPEVPAPRDVSGAEADVAAAGRPAVPPVVRRLDDLTSWRPAAAAAVAACSDDASSAADVAAAVSADPALASRLLRTANSAYFGQSGRVADLGRAVSVVGVRGVQAMAAAALASAGDGEPPPGWWARSVTTASAGRVLAVRFGVPAAEAFAAGLLADVGVALLHAHDPVAWAAVAVEVEDLDDAERLEREAEVFGIDHVDLARRLGEVVVLPGRMVEGFAQHHDREASTPLGRLLCTAVAIVEDRDDDDVAERSGGLLDADEVDVVREDAEQRAEVLSAVLGG